MRFQYILILGPLFLAGCASNPVWQADANERVPVNTPALISDLQALRSAGEFGALQNRYDRSVPLTLAKIVELYVPADFAVIVEPGIDVSRTLMLDRSRTWSDAFPQAMQSAGIVVTFDARNKTIRLARVKALFASSGS